jgi:predicted RNase H-like HicB family nuclease
MSAHTYRIHLRPEPEGGYTVFVPTLPGCITYGESIGEAIAMVREAIELYLEELTDRKESIKPLLFSLYIKERI